MTGLGSRMAVACLRLTVLYSGVEDGGRCALGRGQGGGVL
jgi:hypothetical protein